MNTRLRDLYEKIAAENRSKILRNEIEVDRHISKSIQGVTLQIDLSKEIKQAVRQIQEELGTIEPASLYFSPLKFAHISFNQVVYWNGRYQLGYEKTWESIAKEFIVKFSRLNKTFPAFSITFSRLIATYGAIIFCAEDKNDELEKLREYFFEKLPFPEETPKRNHFIHTSIARFTNKLCNPQEVLTFVEKYKTNISMPVSNVILRNENRYPSLNAIEIARINLI